MALSTAPVFYWGYDAPEKPAEGINKINLFGGKGANCAEMSYLGLPVPVGFTLTTEVCNVYATTNKHPEGTKEGVEAGIAKIEKATGKKFGSETDPLLVSVRSGARVSMPGMMDTILNLGLNDETVKGLIAKSGDRRFSMDSYRRFIQMYGDVVLDLGKDTFEHILEKHKHEKGVKQDYDMKAEDWELVIVDYKKIVQEKTGKPFPMNVWEQLWGAINAVFGSWMNARAVTYRKLNRLDDSWGTACTVMAMVFGNMGFDSGTGVGFTRNPSNGDNSIYGEYLLNAQGEDVVAGIRTPQPITLASKKAMNSELASMEESLPEVYTQLITVMKKLENHFRDMQDIEFTIEKNKLWMLQTRNGKRTAAAAVKIAVDLVEEGKITKEEAIMRVKAEELDRLLHPQVDAKAKKTVIGKGLPASPGAAVGMVYFNADDAEHAAKEGKDVILVRIDTCPDDIHGMFAARGILTSRGGMTSHAAVVARGMGRTCVAGCGDVKIDYSAKTLVGKAGEVIKEGEFISIDGGNGEVYLGKVPLVAPAVVGAFSVFMGWADSIRRMKVRANAETILDATKARELGAEGIGLVRSEHMFFNPPERILAFRHMIVAKDVETRKLALAKLLPMQRNDYYHLFKIMKPYPVTVRYLDPPLHEFIPKLPEEFEELHKVSGIPIEDIKHRCEQLHEANPMLGHRGCRLGITYPEIFEMQTRAVIEAACDLKKDIGETVVPEIMIPIVMAKRELDILYALVERVTKDVLAERKVEIEYKIGTMIELPRAALLADKIAENAQFFSFGTNDLTQTTLGISRDDSGAFMGDYLEKKNAIFARDPFAELDQEGVGMLIKMAVEKGRKTRPGLKCGICGEHGGDPTSVIFVDTCGLDYVSCSPFRVPLARLAAAQATIMHAKK